MHFVLFNEIFPEIALEETRTIQIISSSKGNKTFSFLEFYCADPHCDCRKVIIGVFSQDLRMKYGEFDFGWEEKPYYDRHFGFTDHNLPGPCHSPLFYLEECSDFFLYQFQALCSSDPHYVNRLKKHYGLIKAVAKKQDLLKQKPIEKEGTLVGRNDPCPCGSHKKFKKCCYKKTAVLPT